MKALARFAAPRKAEERCGLCGAPIGERHPHLVETSSGKLLCGCDGCAGVFDHASGRFRKVPGRVSLLPGFRLDGTPIPVGTVFFRRRPSSVVAVYPSPLGPVESTIDPAAWDALVRDHPRLGALEEDVEGVLVRPGEAFIAPIDACYALVGLIRRTWRGFGGGDGVAPAVESFFADLRARAGEAP